jgi:capsular exopolysaccharide synthesis family protein
MAEAKRLAGYRFQNDQFTVEIDRTQHMYDAVVKRLDEVNLIKDLAGGINTQVISPPGSGWLVKPRLSVVLIMASMLGALVGFGVGYLIDRADKSFRSPEEIRRQLGVAVVGHIPTIEISRRNATTAETAGGKIGLAPSLCTYHQPTSRSAEAYRAVRTALYFTSRAEELKVIQVTSPYPGDGKTTLAANLSVSMADSGKRILLLEADFRRPRIHKYFALNNTQGVSSVINGTATIADVVQATVVKNLWAMPCGPKPHNPADLLTSPQFKELLDTLREQYDFVIVDSPPILAVTDSSVIAPRVDAVLLIMRLTNHAREGGTRAVEVLNGLGARILGVVVNGIGRSQGYGYRNYAYRYGGNRYGYQYRGYSLGYRGGGGGDGYYYSDSIPDTPAPAAQRETGNGKE